MGYIIGACIAFSFVFLGKQLFIFLFRQVSKTSYWRYQNYRKNIWKHREECPQFYERALKQDDWLKRQARKEERKRG